MAANEMVCSSQLSAAVNVSIELTSGCGAEGMAASSEAAMTGYEEDKHWASEEVQATLLLLLLANSG